MVCNKIIEIIQTGRKHIHAGDREGVESGESCKAGY